MTQNEIMEGLKLVRSKVEAEAWAKSIQNDHETFQSLWQIVLKEEDRSSWRAFWVMDKATEKNHRLIEPILEELYQLMMSTKNESYIRHGMKMIFRYPINEELALPLLDIMLIWMNKQNAKMSSRGCALLLFYEIYKIYPELKPELEGVLEDQREKQPSAGMLCVIRRIQKELKL